MQDDQLKRIQADVDLMNKVFENPGMEPQDEPQTDPPATEEPVVDPQTDPPDTEPVDDQETEPPKTDPPATEAPDERDTTIAELRKKIEEYETKSKPPEPLPTEAPKKFEEKNFLDNLDFDDVTRDPDEFNKLLNKVYKQGIDSVKEEYGKRFDDLPVIISQQMEMVNNMAKSTEAFYESNKDLSEFKQTVATVYGEVAEANSGKSYDELLTLTADETRKRLGLKPPDKNVLDKGNPPPKLPKRKTKPGHPTEQPTKSTLETELDEMNKVIRR